MKIIPQWRRAWRYFSVQAQALALAGIGTWQVLPDEWRAAVPSSVLLGLAMGCLALGIVGRLIAQPGADTSPPKGTP